jgi:hypothetical protein
MAGSLIKADIGSFSTCLKREMQEVFMNRSYMFSIAVFISAALLTISAAEAKDIRDYFKMADQDQGQFDSSLFEGAKQLLKDEGRTDLADQLDRLFTEVKPGNKVSNGMADYEANLAAMLVAEVNREVRNPNLPHLQAERAFRDTARDHGIPLPAAFDSIAGNFKPKSPPKQLASQ